jgi:hypothetical protein
MRLYLRQSVMLTGLSSPKFNNAIQFIRTIEDIFQRQAVDGNMEAWVPSAFQGHPSIDVGNCYFIPRQHALQDQQISFSTTIEPDNILSERSLPCPTDSFRNPVESAGMKFGRGPCQIEHSGYYLFWRNFAIPVLRLECSPE